MAGDSTLSSLLSSTYILRKPLHRALIYHDYPLDPHFLGQKLKRIRLDLRLQIKQVAQATGINESTIIRWEYDRFPPRSDLLDRVREFYPRQEHPLAARL